jgi:hypothetical protein
VQEPAGQGAGKRRVVTDTGQDVVQPLAGACGIVHVVGGYDANAQPFGQLY